MSKAFHRDVLVLGAGVSGIYQIKRLIDLGLDAELLEADDDLGGTWYRNRYPGCRFDSESYTYGYSFSKELLNEWHWKERFSPQPENLKYLNFVAEKFDLRRHMRFGMRVKHMAWDEETQLWRLSIENGERYTARFVITGIGFMSAPTFPRIEGIDDFKGEAHHTYYWPKEPVKLEGRRVGVIGTGATGIQVIAEIADKVADLKVFQRRPNWSAPLNNSPISEEEMADIRSRYNEIFEHCASTPFGFEHVPMRGFWDHTPEQRRAIWDELYDKPGFAIMAGNFMEIVSDEAANKEISDYIEERIRRRVHDQKVADKLIPKDHGFTLQRLPLETNYFEVYNRPNVSLIDLSETPIERVTGGGIQTSAEHHDLNLIIYATGFDAVTGAYDRMDITGVGGVKLKDKWKEGPLTYFGIMTHGFPNMFMLAGPQANTGSTNYPRAIETSVNWVSDFMEHIFDQGVSRVECTQNAEQGWVDEVKEYHERFLFRNSKGWFTGYNSNVAGRDKDKVRYIAYWGGGIRYKKKIQDAADDNYRGFDLQKDRELAPAISAVSAGRSPVS